MKWENFTVTRIADFKCAEGKKQSIFWDGKTSGLGLRVTATGTKSYIFETSINKKTIRITIGDISTYTISAAQKIATDYKSQTDQGIDPRRVAIEKLDAEQAARDAKELARTAQLQLEAIERDKRELIARDVWDAYLAVPHPKWGAQYRADHNTVAHIGGEPCKVGDKLTKAAPLSFLLCKPLHEITAPVVHDWLANECITRPTFAHNSFRKFRTFIKWCAKHPEYMGVVHADCCITSEVKDIIPASKTKEGDCLQREQLLDWFSSVNKIGSHVIRVYLQALLLTGARRGELAIVKWADIDFKWNSMTIRDKVEGLRTIPLTPYVSHLLAALPRRSEWVFSSPTAASGYITEPRIAHTQALKMAGLPHVSLHGLRRSFGTLSEWVEVPTGVVAQIQGHKPSALAEKHYRRRPIDLLRMWHIKIESWILEQAQIDFKPGQVGLRAIK